MTAFWKRVQMKKSFSRKTKRFTLNEKRKGNVLNGKTFMFGFMKSRSVL